MPTREENQKPDEERIIVNLNVEERVYHVTDDIKNAVITIDK